MSSLDPSRIAFFLATSGHSGVDRIARHLLPSIARRGYQVDLLVVENHGPYIESNEPNLRVIRFPTAHVYTALPYLVRYLRRYRPTVLLSDKDRVNRTSLWAKVISGVETRLVFRQGTTLSVDLASRGLLDRFVQTLSLRYLYRFAEVILVPSQGAARDLARLARLPEAKVRVAPSPVVTMELLQGEQPLPDHPWYREKVPIIIGVGELCARKDFATLIRAFCHLRAKRPLRLIILGRGRQRKRLLELASGLGVAEDVDLPGFVPNPYPFMAHARLLAFSSRWEGLGFVLIEALSLGTPVVSTDCPYGPREILKDGLYGPLVPVGDDLALARAMETVLEASTSKDFLRQAAFPYEVERSTTAYLELMGLSPRRLSNAQA